MSMNLEILENYLNKIVFPFWRDSLLRTMQVIDISWSLETLKNWVFGGGGGGVLMYPGWLKRLNIILKHALKFIACSLPKINFDSFAFPLITYIPLSQLNCPSPECLCWISALSQQMIQTQRKRGSFSK